MEYKIKYLKYKSKCEILEKKIYEYIKKNNIDINKVNELINKQYDKDKSYYDRHGLDDLDMIESLYDTHYF